MNFSRNNQIRLFLLIVLITLSACGGGGGGGASSSACDPIKIAGGASCGVKNSAVVKLTAMTPAGPFGCTGTVVASNMVLTAGHCLIGASFVMVEASNGVTAIAELLRFDPNSIPVPALDYGIAIVSPTFVAESNITPLPIFLGADDYVNSGTPISVFGYGQEESNDGRGRFPKVAEMTVTQLTYTSAPRRDFAFTAIPNPVSGVPGAGCLGDSGGPAIVSDLAGRETGVVGILSGGVGTDGCSQHIGQTLFAGITCKMVDVISQYTTDLRTVSACI